MKSAITAFTLFSLVLCCTALRVPSNVGRSKGNCIPGEPLPSLYICHCFESEKENCYKLALPKALSVPSQVQRSAGEKCRAGEIFDGKNICYCYDSKRRNCKKLDLAKAIGVIPNVLSEIIPELKLDVFENATHCTPGLKFYLGCNLCTCQASGIKYGSNCDNYGCPPFPREYDMSTKCTPGTIFKQDCNSCKCRKYGTVGASLCTRKRCSHTHPELTVFSEPIKDISDEDQEDSKSIVVWPSY